MTTAMRVLKKLLRAAEAEQKTHRRRYGGRCLSSCETLQEIGNLQTVIEAVTIAEKRAKSRADTAGMVMRRALERIARGPYTFEYEHERLEECQQIAASVLAGRWEE